MGYLKVILLLIVLMDFTRFESRSDSIRSDPDNGGLILPNGFEAAVIADSIGPARHLTVRENGDIYVKLRRNTDDGSIVAIRDTIADGVPDVIHKFGIFNED